MKIRIIGLLMFAAAVPSLSSAQIKCTNTSTNLACLAAVTVAPTGYATTNGAIQGQNTGNGQPVNLIGIPFLNSDIGGEISQIPLASPASGIIFTIDPTLHVPVPSDQSLGPILTQRAETIGRHKFYISVTYQYFLLRDADGHGLKSLPTLYGLSSTGTDTPDAIALSNSRVDLKVHQFVGYATFGLTSRIDLSLAVPVLRVDERYTTNEQLFPLTPAGLLAGTPTTFTNSLAREATGIGDIVAAMKVTLVKKRHAGFAAGVEVRLPTGDSSSYLGSGTYGAKPFAAFTYSAKISPHFNVGYQANGTTKLVVNQDGTQGNLPNRLYYSGGADWKLGNHLTVAADILAQRVFDSPRAVIATNVGFQSQNGFTFLPSVLIASTGTYNRTDASLGFKWKPVGNLLITANSIVKLDQGGLRARYVPLFGASYTFH
jgi:hypothetical protein